MTPRDNAQRATVDERPPEPARSTSRYVEANGLKLHFLDYGSEGKPPMLCIHGGGAHAHWFDYVAGNFTADYHVRALDLRGHGDSQWDEGADYSFERYAGDVAAVVERLDLRDFVLIGHSMGGMVSLVYTASHVGRVGRLVVVDTTTQLPADRVAKMHEFGARPPSTYATHDELIARYRLEAAGTQVAAPAVVRRMAEHGAREQSDGTWRHKFDRRVYVNFERRDALPLWARVKIPALLVKGGLSERITPEALAAIKTRAPHVRFAEVADADHHVTLDNPAGFVQAVRAFLAHA